MTPPRPHSKRRVKVTTKKHERVKVTTKKHESDRRRHLIVHDYHDYANVTQEEAEAVPKKRRRGGVVTPFPIKLMETLEKIEADGYDHIISWQPHGRCFVIHKQRQFADQILPEYFGQTKLTSFQRQLNLYGFNRITRGLDAEGYYHELFLRGKPYLCENMVRQRIKGTKIKGVANPDDEPDFYSMPFVGATHPTSTRNAQPPRTVSMGSFGNEGQEHVDSCPSFLDYSTSNSSTGANDHEHVHEISNNTQVSFQTGQGRNVATLITSVESTVPDLIPQGLFSTNDCATNTSPVRSVPLDGVDDGTASNIMNDFAQDWTLPFETEQLVADDVCFGSLLNSVLDESTGCNSVPI